jgi:2'-5' RNA ligase
MDKYLCILAELEDDVQNSLQMYEELISENGFINKQTKGLPYHITLNTYSVEHEDYLKLLLDKIKNNFKQINVVYTSFGLFGLNVIYLNPAMNMQLIELHEFVKERNNDKFNVFAAHTTIFIGEPENTLKLLPILVERANKTTGNLKYISLYEFFPAKLIKRIELVAE